MENLENANERKDFDKVTLHNHDHSDTVWGLVVFGILVVGMIVLARFFG